MVHFGKSGRSSSSRSVVSMFGVLSGAEDITKLMTKSMYTSRLQYDNPLLLSLSYDVFVMLVVS